MCFVEIEEVLGEGATKSNIKLSGEGLHRDVSITKSYFVVLLMETYKRPLNLIMITFIIFNQRTRGQDQFVFQVRRVGPSLWSTLKMPRKPKSGVPVEDPDRPCIPTPLSMGPGLPPLFSPAQIARNNGKAIATSPAICLSHH